MSPRTLLLAILATLGGLGGLAALVRAFIDRPKVRADAVATITNAASSQILSLSARVEVLETRLDETDKKAAAAGQKANSAELQVSRLSWQQQTAAEWHRRHQPFDHVMQKIARQIKPEMLEEPELLREIPALEPFPHWEGVVT
jgi:outer membrane murein-binding lipoprotein Lpp